MEIDNNNQKLRIIFATIIIIILIVAVILVFIRSKSNINDNIPIVKPDIGDINSIKNENAASQVNGSISTQNSDASGNIYVNNDANSKSAEATSTPTILDITDSQSVNDYLLECYDMESSLDKINCYEKYYLYYDNPVKYQYDLCNESSNASCMDKVYDELSVYIGVIACDKILDNQTKQSCVGSIE